MNIIVCAKNVPETAEADLRIDETGKAVKMEGLVFDINEWDNYAIEEALLFKERLGGSVTVITVGSKDADETLRKCLAMGVDKAFEGSNAFATAKILHKAVQNLPFDLILTGTQASDEDGYALVGVVLAELLGIPHATLVKRIEIRNGNVIVHRELEGGLEAVFEVRLPAVLTIQTGIN